MMKIAGILGILSSLIALFIYLIVGTTGGFMLGFAGAGAAGILLAWTAYRKQVAAFVRTRGTKFGANAAIMAGAVLGILVIVNILSYRHNWRGDFTGSRSYSLSEQTLSILGTLTEPVTITAFVLDNGEGAFKDLLESYVYRSKKISYTFVDPDKNPPMTEKYGIKDLWKQGIPGVLVLESGKSMVKITDNSEEAVTNAILKLTRSRGKTVCVVDGHGERDISDAQSVEGFDAARKALEDQNMAVRKILPASLGAIPGDCSAILVAGPRKALVGREAEIIASAVDRGVGAFLLLDPAVESGYRALLARWGMDLGDNIVVEPTMRLFAGPSLGLEPIVGKYGDHPITANFRQNTIFSMSRSVTPAKDPPPGFTVTSLARTSEESWAETDLMGVIQKGEAKLDAGDARGPVSLASAALVKTGNGQYSRVVAVGSSAFANNKYLPALYNRDFFLNCVTWLAGDDAQITIRPREGLKGRVFLTQSQADFVYYVTLFILPGIVVAIGVFVWRKRRNL